MEDSSACILWVPFPKLFVKSKAKGEKWDKNKTLQKLEIKYNVATLS